MIKRYNQFVKQVNENIEEPSFEETEGRLAAQDLEAELDNFEEEEEEEAGDIYQKRLQEVADLLGVEVIDNKVIFNNEEIIFPSETEMYHVGKKKFKTVDEVVKYLQGEEVTTESKSYKNRYK
jgi:hypothetical protein